MSTAEPKIEQHYTRQINLTKDISTAGAGIYTVTVTRFRSSHPAGAHISISMHDGSGQILGTLRFTGPDHEQNAEAVADMIKAIITMPCTLTMTGPDK